VNDEVLEMEEFAVDPQRGGGVGEILALTKRAPTSERAMRSSRQVNAAPVSKAGRIRAFMLIFARS
jgi:hypothetical protein